MVATDANYVANLAGTFGGYERRQDEWVHQSRLALAEMKQLNKQIVATQIRSDIAERELDNHEQQMQNAQEVDDFMRSKFTNQQLFSWLASQIFQVYSSSYNLALDQARRAERAFQYELGVGTEVAPYIETNHWDSLRSGLLAGEHLHYDLKRMESAYLERNVREYEITKHVSLLALDPVALIALRQTCQCDVSIPEVLFDLDYPGHYFRRLKSVSLTIPCVTGTYTGVSCTLTLINSSMRRDASASEPYMKKVDEADPRFVDSFGVIQSIVTSSAQNDSGLFETNLRDERYLPFEGVGVISTWRLELPKSFHAYDYATISDVILHLRYTARDGGSDLKALASGKIVEQLNGIQASSANNGLVRLFSLRHEYPTEWQQFRAQGAPTEANSTTLILSKSRFPYLFANGVHITGLEIFAQPGAVDTEITPESLILEVVSNGTGAMLLPKTIFPQPPSPPQPGVPATPPTTPFIDENGLLHGIASVAPGIVPTIDGPTWTVTGSKTTGGTKRLDPDALANIWIACRYSVAKVG
jgi:hypothetical protein